MVSRKFLFTTVVILGALFIYAPQFAYNAHADMSASFFCSGSHERVSITWNAAPGSVQGYRIMKNGSQIATDTSSPYIDTAATVGSHTYAVVVIYPFGSSSGHGSDQVTVTNCNGAPNAQEDNYTVGERERENLNILSNDSDPDTDDGDSISIRGVSGSTYGGTVRNRGSYVEYTAPSVSGSTQDYFDYTIEDESGATDFARVYVNVEEQTFACDMFMNVNDSSVSPGEEIRIVWESNYPSGYGDFEGYGEWSGTYPRSGIENINAPTSFGTYTYGLRGKAIGDPECRDTVTVTVTNNAPLAAWDAYYDLQCGNTYNLPVLSNDSDPDGDTLRIVAATDPSDEGGDVTDYTGYVRYRAPSNHTGSDRFRYTITDGNNRTSSAYVYINGITCNDDPNANNDSYTVDKNSSNNIFNVLSNDSDSDGDSISLQSVNDGNQGGNTSRSSNRVVYTPDSGFSGTETFSYTISDGRGGTDSATVTVTVRNNAPNASDDTYSNLTCGGSYTLSIRNNDSDPDGDTTTIDYIGGTQDGASVTNYGSYVRYHMPDDFDGYDYFRYRIRDTNGYYDSGSYAYVRLNGEDCRNASPNASNDSYNVQENSSNNIFSVTSNDSDPNGDTLTLQSNISSPSQGGSAVRQSQTTIRYTPRTNFYGSESFNYSISDGRGGSDSATVSVAVNGTPNASNDSYTVNKNSSNNIFSVTSNDSDPQGDTLTLQSNVSSPSQGGFAVRQSQTTIRYTPVGDFSGSESFSYSLSDGRGGSDSANVSVNVVNRSPNAGNNSYGTFQCGTTHTLSVLNNDSDPDGDTLRISSVENPSDRGGSVSNRTTYIRYTAPSYRGTDTFDYTVSDGNGGTDTARVSMTVECNEPPVASGHSYTMWHDESPEDYNVLSGDYDPDGDSVRVYDITSQPQYGSVSRISNSTVRYSSSNSRSSDYTDTFTYRITDSQGGYDTANVSVNVRYNDAPNAVNDSRTLGQCGMISAFRPSTVLSNDSDPDGHTISFDGLTSSPIYGSASVSGNSEWITYDARDDWSGTDYFNYRIRDSRGLTDTARITINVPNANPIARNNSYSVPNDASTNLSVLSNDSDSDGDTITIRSISSPSNVTATNRGTYITVRPDNGFEGTSYVQYTIEDTCGGTDTARAYLASYSPNTKPVAVSDTASVAGGSGWNRIRVLSNDSDPDGDSISLNYLGSASHGWTQESGNDVLYRPVPGYKGSDSFQYDIRDSNNAVSNQRATVSITINNIGPVAANDTYSVQENSTAGQNRFFVLENDSDGNNDSLIISQITNAPDHGTATINGSHIRYRPSQHYDGPDSFAYRVSDGNGGTDTATVSITVVNVNRDPIATNDSEDVYKSSQDNSLDVLSNDSDPDGETITIRRIVSGPSNGTARISSNNRDILYTPDVDYPESDGESGAVTGPDSLQYEIEDESGGRDIATVSITVIVPRDYFITAVPSQVKLSNYTYGTSDPVTLTITRLYGFTGAVTLEVIPSSIPAALSDATLSFSDTNLSSGESESIFTIEVPEEIPAGAYPLEIRARSTELGARTEPLILTVEIWVNIEFEEF